MHPISQTHQCSITEAFVDQLQDTLTHTHRLGIDWLREQLRIKFQARGLTDEQIDAALVVGETSALMDAVYDSSFDDDKRDLMVEQINEWIATRRYLENGDIGGELE